VYPVKLVGPRVIVREFRADDVDSVFAIIGDDRVTNSLSFDSRGRPESEAMIKGVLQRAQDDPRTEYYLAVDAPELVGFVRLGLSGVRAAKLGYAIRADQWGNGYASEACELILGLAFSDLNLHRVTAAIGPQNHASIALSRRLGFTEEGNLRDHVYTNGDWRDSRLFSLLSDEWTARQNPND
jgi:ribosomal-protein-alanine N-acetyltransferase